MSDQPFNQPLEDEISLKEIIDFLSESWKAIALSGIVGGLLATGYAFITPPKYQATAHIQVAKVAGADVEVPSSLVEKLKMPMYYSTETYSACNVMNRIEPGLNIVKNIKPTLAKASPFISFSYLGDSREDAQKCLESIVNDIRSNQNLLAKQILEIKKNQLTYLKQKLDNAERIMKTLPNKNPSFDFFDSKFSASVLLLTTTLSKVNEITDLRAQINDLEIELSELQTKEASYITPIYVPKQKASPKLIIVLTVGLIGGLFLGLLFMVGKRSWHAYKALNQ